jgi:hypothetical protein
MEVLEGQHGNKSASQANLQGFKILPFGAADVKKLS